MEFLCSCEKFAPDYWATIMDIYSRCLLLFEDGQEKLHVYQSTVRCYIWDPYHHRSSKLTLFSYVTCYTFVKNKDTLKIWNMNGFQTFFMKLLQLTSKM